MLTMPERWTIRGLIILVVVVGLLALKDGCQKFVPTNPTETEKLKDDEKERIIVNDSGDVVHVVRRTGRTVQDQVAYRDSGAVQTTITVANDGTIKVTQRTKGFIFRPGFCIGTSTDGLLVGADAQFFFIRNLGLNAGITTSVRGHADENVRAHIAVSYRIPVSYFRNTSVYSGYSTKNEFIAGIRVGF